MGKDYSVAFSPLFLFILDNIETELFYIFVAYNSSSEREFPFLGLSTHVGNEQDY